MTGKRGSRYVGRRDDAHEFGGGVAGRVGGADVQSLRQFVGQSPWAVEQIQQWLAEKVVDLLAEPEVWMIDETFSPRPERLRWE